MGVASPADETDCNSTGNSTDTLAGNAVENPAGSLPADSLPAGSPPEDSPEATQNLAIAGDSSGDRSSGDRSSDREGNLSGDNLSGNNSGNNLSGDLSGDRSDSPQDAICGSAEEARDTIAGHLADTIAGGSPGDLAGDPAGDSLDNPTGDPAGEIATGDRQVSPAAKPEPDPDDDLDRAIAEALPPAVPAAPADFRSGFVSIVGRPNTGKSTLLNHLVGQKVAIVSPVAQTTRNRLQGILTTPRAQVILVDTPGIHKPHHQLGEILVHNARAAIHGADLLLFVVDGSVPAGKGDRYIADLLRAAGVPVLLGANKLDRADPPEPHPSYGELAAEAGWPIAGFSALTGDGTDALLDRLVERLEPGPYYYPPDLVTDRPERFVMGELIREQILLQTREEVPHSVAIAVEAVEETPKLTRIHATIYAERQSQKGILIGKKGSMLKAIGTAAREQIQRLVDGPVYLELFVKVRPKWRQSRSRLQELGYRRED